MSRYRDPSTTFLADAASGIFDPGWDISFSGNDEADFFAASGLGNPFPEDAKLCAALNSYWPSVAPDATRTFGLCPPDKSATTAIPLMDGELGCHPRHPRVRAGLVVSKPGWDGEYGPFFDQGGRYVNHADLDRTDYVSRAMRRELSLALLSTITPGEFFRRMNALRACIGVLPERPKRVSETKLFLVSALKVADWAGESDRGDPRLLGEGYRFEFVILDGKARTMRREDHRVRRKVAKRYTCQIAARGVCWRHEPPDQGDFVFCPTALAV